LQFIRDGGHHKDLDAEEMKAIVRLGVYCAEAHRVPVLDNAISPRKKTGAQRALPCRALAVSSSGSQIVILGVLADRTAGRIFPA